MCSAGRSSAAQPVRCSRTPPRQLPAIKSTMEEALLNEMNSADHAQRRVLLGSTAGQVHPAQVIACSPVQLIFPICCIKADYTQRSALVRPAAGQVQPNPAQVVACSPVGTVSSHCCVVMRKNGPAVDEPSCYAGHGCTSTSPKKLPAVRVCCASCHGLRSCRRLLIRKGRADSIRHQTPGHQDWRNQTAS